MPLPLLASALSLTLALTLAGAAYGQAAPIRYEVRVEAPKALAQMLREGLNLTRWREDPQMTAELLERLVDEAVRQAREAVATEGYFSAKVAAAIDRAAEPWLVTIRVEPGERTRVSDTEIRYAGPAAEDRADGRMAEVLRRIRSEWPLRPGDPFRQKAWDEAKQLALREMSSWRYAGARIAHSAAHIDPATHTARLTVEIDSGPPYRFGPVTVSGSKRYPERIVRNLSPAGPGEPYDRDKLLIYQRRLLETGYFVSAQVDVDRETGTPEAAPLRVVVIEGSSQNLEAGLGYNTDTGPRVELRYTNRDIFDSAWRFKSAFRFDPKIQHSQIDFDAPPRPDASWRSYFGRVQRSDINNELTREVALGAAHNWGLERTPDSLYVSAHVEDQQVVDEAVERRHALFFGYRRPFRRTDDLVSPRRGYLGTVELGGAPPGVSTRQFVRGTAGATLFIPVARNADLQVRGRVGLIAATAREGIPSTFLFRTGGDQTVRGYAYESLGVPRREAVVGARRLAWASLEYTRWIGENWGIAPFIDVGDAWDRERRFKPAWGYGAGVRVRTPIGPIRADLAWGQLTGKLRLHFSVGYAF